MNYEKSLRSLAREIEKSIEWRQENNHKTNPYDRWLDRIETILGVMESEQESFNEREIAFRNRIVELEEENFKCRVILTYLSSDVKLSSKYFFDCLLKEIRKSTLERLVEEIDETMAECGVPPKKIFHG